jgi:deaminated glutathione amidase
MKLRVAGAQIAVTQDIVANVQTIERAIAFAVAEKADVLLTPEGSLSGYTPFFDRQVVIEALQAVTARARAAHLGLALGTCFVEDDDDRTYNQIRFYDPDGTYLGFHSKTLTCGTLTDPPRGEIEHYAVRSLRTFDLQGVRVGGLICNDLWANPGCTPQPDVHLSQQLALLGARIIFHAVNGGRDGSAWAQQVVWPYHESNLRMRAQAGQVWIVTVDNAYPFTMPCSAPSGVLSPQGEWLVQAPAKGEQFYAYTIELT